MRYIYHPQLDCYLVAVNSDCSRPCELTLSCRQAVALCELTRLLVSDFFRIIPATTSRLNCSSRQVVARVCCFQRFCIKPMRYIYYPQHDCYLVAVNSDCSRPCELNLTLLLNSFTVLRCYLEDCIQYTMQFCLSQC